MSAHTQIATCSHVNFMLAEGNVIQFETLRK